MSDFALTGKKGTGKSKNAIRIIRDQYLKKGFTVATNLDVFLEPMFGEQSRKTYIRVPDKPTEFDLLAAGHGNPASYDEDKNGALVLDELGTWLNARSFADKDRAGMLDFLAHGRKHGWNCYYIMQAIAQVDKQLRESFIEYTVRHVRFDKVRIPIFGGVIKALFGERMAYLPRFHVAATRIGYNPQDLKTDSVMYRGDDLHACYDTRQVFDARYPHGTHTVLSPWHVKGRYLPSPPSPWYVRLRDWLKASRLPVKARPPRPVDPAFVRVRALAMALPADQRVRVMQRYIKAMDGIRPARRSAIAGHSAGRSPA